jgi:hypothetical protein
MKRMPKVILLLSVGAILASCTFAYAPPQDIAAAPYVNSIHTDPQEPVRIEDATTQDTVIASRTGFYTYSANLSKFGAAVTASLERELVKNGFQVTPETAKTIRIDVIDVEMAYPKKYRCDIELAVGVGEKTVGIATDSPASSFYTAAIDAAVADAVRRILTHPEVVAYLTE